MVKISAASKRHATTHTDKHGDEAMIEVWQWWSDATINRWKCRSCREALLRHKNVEHVDVEAMAPLLLKKEMNEETLAASHCTQSSRQ